MPGKDNYLRRVVRLVLDEASAKQAARDMEAALAKAGDQGGKDFFRNLQKQYGSVIADLRIKFANDPMKLREMEAAAKRAFNGQLIPALQKARAEGSITEAQFVSLSKRIKTVGTEGGSSVGALESGLKRLAGWLATGYLAKKFFDFGKSSVKAAADAEEKWAHLAATVESTGTKFERGRLEAMAKRFQATTAYGDEAFATTLDRLIQLTGKYALSLSNVGLVANVAAKYYKGELAPAADLVGRLLTGQTRMLREVGIVTKDAQEGYRILAQRSMGAAGAAAETLTGQTKQLGAAWEDVKEELGAALIEGAKGPSVLQALTQSVRDLSKWIRANRDDLADMAKGLLGVAVAAVRAAADLRRTFNPAAAIFGDNVAGIQAMEGFGTPKFATFLSARLGTEQQQTPALQARLAQLMSKGAKDWAQINYLKAEIEANQRTIAWIIDEMGKLARGETSGIGALPGKGLGPGPAARTGKKEQGPKAGPGSPWMYANTSHEFNAAVAAGVRTGLTRVGTDQTSAGVVQPLFSPREILAREQELALVTLADQYRERFKDIEDAASHAAMGVTGAWQDAFGVLFKEGATLGKFFGTLGKGIAGALLGGIAEFASKKVQENIAWAAEDVALGLADLILNPADAATKFAAAAQHGIAAAAWGVLAGGAGASQAAVAGGSRGGTSGGVPSGASDVGGRIAERAAAPGPEINIYVDGFDPFNPRHQDMVGYSQDKARERWGQDATIHYYPRTGS